MHYTRTVPILPGLYTVTDHQCALLPIYWPYTIMAPRTVGTQFYPVTNHRSTSNIQTKEQSQILLQYLIDLSITVDELTRATNIV